MRIHGGRPGAGPDRKVHGHRGAAGLQLTFYRDTEPWIAAAVSKHGDPERDAALFLGEVL